MCKACVFLYKGSPCISGCSDLAMQLRRSSCLSFLRAGITRIQSYTSNIFNFVRTSFKYQTFKKKKLSLLTSPLVCVEFIVLHLLNYLRLTQILSIAFSGDGGLRILMKILPPIPSSGSFLFVHLLR